MGLIAIRDRLDPEARAALEQSERIAAANPSPEPGDVAAMRAAYDADRAFWNEGGPLPETRIDAEIDADGRAIPIRVYKPEGDGPHPVLVFLHGGGWILGSPDTHDRIARHLCVASGWAVLSVDYRLAPECRFPGPLLDCMAVLDALPDRAASFGLDPSRVAVGGDSAGANMSLACLVHLRGVGRPACAGLLFYGAYGLRDSASRRLYGGAEDGLSEEDLDVYFNALMTDPEDAKDPRFNLLRADLTDLPPLYILEVALDPLADDSRALAALLSTRGQRHERHVYDGVLHGFLHLGRMVAKARRGLDEGADFLNRYGG